MIRFTSDYQMPGRFARLIDWLLTRHAFARRNRDYLGGLARLAERRPCGSEARKGPLHFQSSELAQNS